MPFIEVDSKVRLYYEDYGSGKPIVFVHGRGAAHDAWQYQLEKLRSEFRVLAIDMRGHGFSDKPNAPYNHEMFARDVRAFVQSLKLKDVTLVGWSTGSFTLLKYADLFGDAPSISKIGLVGSTPVFAARKDFPDALKMEFFEQLKANHRQNHPLAVRNFVNALFWKAPDAATADWLFEMVMRTPLPVLLETLDSNMAMDYRRVLKKITMPTVLLQGKHDKLCFFEATKYMHEHIPNSELVPFENSGHSPFLEETDKFNEELTRFALK